MTPETDKYAELRDFVPVNSGKRWAVGFDLPAGTPDGFGIPPDDRKFVVNVGEP